MNSILIKKEGAQSIVEWTAPAEQNITKWSDMPDFSEGRLCVFKHRLSSLFRFLNKILLIIHMWASCVCEHGCIIH